MNRVTKTDFIHDINCPESLWLLKNKDFLNLYFQNQQIKRPKME